MKAAGSRPSSITRDIEEEEKKGVSKEIPLKDQHARDSRDEQMETIRKQRVGNSPPVKMSM